MVTVGPIMWGPVGGQEGSWEWCLAARHCQGTPDGTVVNGTVTPLSVEKLISPQQRLEMKDSALECFGLCLTEQRKDGSITLDSLWKHRNVASSITPTYSHTQSFPSPSLLLTYFYTVMTTQQCGEEKNGLLPRFPVMISLAVLQWPYTTNIWQNTSFHDIILMQFPIPDTRKLFQMTHNLWLQLHPLNNPNTELLLTVNYCLLWNVAKSRGCIQSETTDK